ncbi:MAG: hypothetical protein QOI78_8219 [Actinomycetota bacterium]|jgi:hypothetical protein|nr:hypothetical protein [Actinomycetota bacterium]
MTGERHRSFGDAAQEYDGGRLGVAGLSPDPFADWVADLFDTDAEPHKGKVRRIYVDVELPAGAPCSSSSRPTATT